MRCLIDLRPSRLSALCIFLFISSNHAKVHEVRITMGSIPLLQSELLPEFLSIGDSDPRNGENFSDEVFNEKILTEFLVPGSQDAIESSLSFLLLPPDFIWTANYLVAYLRDIVRQESIIAIFGEIPEQEDRDTRYFRSIILLCLSSSLLMFLSFGSVFLMRFSSITKCCSEPSVVELEIEEYPSELAVRQNVPQNNDPIEKETIQEIICLKMSSNEMDQGFLCLQSINKQLESLNELKIRWEEQLNEKNIKLESLSIDLNTALADKFSARSQIKSQQEAIDKLTERLWKRCQGRNLADSLKEASSEGWESEEEVPDVEIRCIPNRNQKNNLRSPEDPRRFSDVLSPKSTPKSSPKSIRQLSIMTCDSINDNQGLTSPCLSLYDEEEQAEDIDYLSAMRSIKQKLAADLSSVVSTLSPLPSPDKRNVSKANLYRKVSENVKYKVEDIHILLGQHRSGAEFKRVDSSPGGFRNGKFEDDKNEKSKLLERISELTNIRDEKLLAAQQELFNAEVRLAATAATAISSVEENKILLSTLEHMRAVIDQSTADLARKESECAALQQDLFLRDTVTEEEGKDSETKESVDDSRDDCTFAPLTVLVVSTISTNRESPATTMDTCPSVSSAAYTEDDVIRLSDELDMKIQELITSKMDHAQSASRLDHAHLKISLLNNQLQSYFNNKSGPIFESKHRGVYPSKLPRPVKKNSIPGSPGSPTSVRNMMFSP